MKSIKLSLLAGLAAVALSTTSSLAADIAERSYVKVPPSLNAPIWTGFYIGGQVGGASMSSDYVDDNDTFDNQGLNADRDNGFTGGIYGGYNWQFGSFVVGVDAQWSWYDLTTRSFPFGFDDAAFITAEIRDAGSVKARFGLAFTDTLVYVAAGPAWANSKFSAFDDIEIVSGDKLVSGYAAAIGVEHMFTPNWILRGQVQYAGYNTQRIGPADGFSVAQTSDVVEATVGISYKFGPWW